MTDQLIAKLEAAEAGSRELSDEVLIALGYMESQWAEIGLWRDPTDNTIRSATVPDAKQRPSPTQYVDDALGLVPVGLIWRMDSEMSHTRGRPVAALYKWVTEVTAATSSAATPALALCAAILRTQAQEG